MESPQSINPILLDPAYQPDKQFASYKNFTPVRMTSAKPETRQVPGNSGATYSQLPMLYNYGAGGLTSYDDLYLELCEMKAGGLVSKTPPGSAKVETSVQIRFTPGNEDHEKVINCFDEIYKACAQGIENHKGPLKMASFRVEAAEMVIKHPIYRPVDPVTCVPLVGRSPCMYLKCFTRGTPPYEEKTLFTRPDKTIIDWSLLYNSDITFIPLIHLKRIYVGSKPSIQLELFSAVVTSIRPRGTSTRQGTTCDNLCSENPDIVDLVASQVNRIATERQDQLLSATESSSSSSSSSSLSPTPQIPSMPQGQSSPQSNSYSGFSGFQPGSVGLPPVPSISDFVSSSPVRTMGYPTSTPSFN